MRPEQHVDLINLCQFVHVIRAVGMRQRMVPLRHTVYGPLLARALTGLVLATITVALIAAGLWRLYSATGDGGNRPTRPAIERMVQFLGRHL